MATSITVSIFCVLCLILLQNQVNSKPTPQDGKPPQHVDSPTDPASQQPQNAAQTQPQPAQQPQQPQQPTGGQSAEPADTKASAPPETTTILVPAGTDHSQSPSTTKNATPKEATPAVGEKKDQKGASTVVFANFGLLAVSALLITRL